MSMLGKYRMINYQLELFVEFDEIINLKTVVYNLDIVTNTVTVRMDLNEQFKDIGKYLKEQCFCHTDKRPIISFKYNDGYSECARYDIPHHDIEIDEKYVYFKIPFSKWLDLSSASFGGMYG